MDLNRRTFIGSAGFAALAAAGLTSCSDLVDDPAQVEDAAPTEMPGRASRSIDDLFSPLKAPTRLVVRRNGPGALRLGWPSGCVGAGPAAYDVIVDGAVAQTVTGLTAVITGLVDGRQYSVQVQTVDAAGARSLPTATTVIAPAVDAAIAGAEFPVALAVTPAASALQFQWSYASDYTGPRPDAYQLIQVGELRPRAATSSTSGAAPMWSLLEGVPPGQPAEYVLRCFAEDGSFIGTSVNSVRVESYARDWPTAGDFPSAPTMLSFSTTPESSTLSWSPPSSESSELACYNIFSGTTLIGSVPAAASTWAIPVGDTPLALTVVAVDIAGNASSQSSSVEVLTDEAALRSLSSATFQIVNGEILDPDGRPFVPIGANVSGMDFFWNEQIFGTAGAASDQWGWTAVRVGCGIADWGAVSGTQGNIFSSNNHLDRVVDEFTSRKIAVVIAQHNKGVPEDGRSPAGGLLDTTSGSAPDSTGRSVEEATIDWWVQVARRYADNPYVWLNLINEPGSDLTGLDAQYSRMLPRIRAVAPYLPVVLDATNFANDIPNDSTIGDGPVRENESFVLSKGAGLVERYGPTQGLGPVVFSMHLYSRWPRNYSTNEQIPDILLAQRIRQYIVDARAKNLAVLIGETGVEDWAREYDSASVRVGLYQGGSVDGRTTGVLVEQRVGVLAWHASPVSGMRISTKPWDQVVDVSGATPPPDAGQGLWNYGRSLRRPD